MSTRGWEFSRSPFDPAAKIRGRAVRRMGEILNEMDRPSTGGRPKKNSEPGRPVSRKQAAEDAGISEQQQKQAQRVAKVPEDEFEADASTPAP